MGKYTWDEYYKKFYDWSKSKRANNLHELISLGSVEEVGEIIGEFEENISASNSLLEKAVKAKLVFSGSYLREFACVNDKELVAEATLNSFEILNADEIADILIELQYSKSAFNRVLEKAVEEKIIFSAYSLRELTETKNKKLVADAIVNSLERLNADEVGEMIIELEEDIAASNCVLKKVVEEKLAFSGTHLVYFLYINNKKLVGEAAINSMKRLNTNEVEEILSELENHVSLTNRLLKKVVEAKLSLSGSCLCELVEVNNKNLVAEVIMNSFERLSADEIGEMIVELAENISASNKVLKQAVETKIVFSSAYLNDFLYENDKSLVANATINSMSQLATDEVGKIIVELQDTISSSNRVLKKAVEAKYSFSAIHLDDFLHENNKDLVVEAILNSMERLTADEIGNIIVNLQEDIVLSNRILKKAVNNRVIFSTSSLTAFSFANNKKLVADAVRNSAKEFTSESLDELRGIIDDKLIREISQQQNLPLYDYGYAEESFDSNQGGFLFTLLSLFSGFNQKENSNHYKHNGRCNGDCAHCPDHYGYRYGRWYYGHNHTEGCEFGGNKGSGGSD